MHSTVHLLWLWMWFIFGVLTYMVKRAFYLITGPSPVANNVGQFIRVAGVPLFFRLVVDSAFYWACFTPAVLQNGLSFLGWQSGAGLVNVVTQFGVMALVFGLGIDPIVDWIFPTIIAKVPFLKDFWPQMPGPPPPLEKP